MCMGFFLFILAFWLVTMTALAIGEHYPKAWRNRPALNVKSCPLDGQDLFLWLRAGFPFWLRKRWMKQP